MESYRIHCIIHDKNDVIIKVGIGNDVFDVIKIVNWILEKKYFFYTFENNVRAEVYAKQHPTSGRWFLTTKPDSIDENNLDFLPRCRQIT